MVAGEEEASKPMAPFRGINNWRRCALRMLLVVSAGTSAAIVNYLQESRMEHEEQAKRRGCGRAKGLLSEEDGPKASKDKKEPAGLKAVAKGAPMPPSKTDNYSLSEALCHHPADRMAARGNSHMTWSTCLDCGSRWKRTDEEVNRVRAAVAAEASGIVPPECKCGHQMVLRSNHQDGGKFFGCSQYPTCHFTSKLMNRFANPVSSQAPPPPPPAARRAAATGATSSSSSGSWIHVEESEDRSVDGDSCHPVLDWLRARKAEQRIARRHQDSLDWVRARKAEQRMTPGMTPEGAVDSATYNLTEEEKARAVQILRQMMASHGTRPPDPL
jgi:ssDNA-binding Zn-finger/Zn-ribbon topoisomerase 1